jgi:hypothetical protein
MFTYCVLFCSFLLSSHISMYMKRYTKLVRAYITIHTRTHARTHTHAHTHTHTHTHTWYSVPWILLVLRHPCFLGQFNFPFLMACFTHFSYALTKCSEFFYNLTIYRVAGDFISVFQNLLPEVIPSQKYPRNVGLNLNKYGAILIESSCCSFSIYL